MWMISHASEIVLYLYAADRLIEALPIPSNSVFQAIGHILKPLGTLIKNVYAATQTPKPPGS
jgi:hypothetical protein